MQMHAQCDFADCIQGQILRLNGRREVAIFLFHGSLWVADFIDGKGELVDAATWIRFNCSGLATAHGRRRMVLESALPLSRELVSRIEILHRAGQAQGNAVVRDAEPKKPDAPDETKQHGCATHHNHDPVQALATMKRPI